LFYFRYISTSSTALFIEIVVLSYVEYAPRDLGKSLFNISGRNNKEKGTKGNKKNTKI